jgi:K+-sensing histidine kinase KdpD
MNGEFLCSPCHRAGEQIIKECTDHQATMVVLGTRGLGAVRRTILGSVSDYVVHHAHCPVIVCRQ